MAISGDVTFQQDGGQVHAKMHPYLMTLVRWCVECVWSVATVMLQRVVAGSIPSLPTVAVAGLTAIKPPQKRAASKDHLHPEPKVECQVLHTPERHSFDVIFVHGLYGSLGNTWRQGDWRSKYKLEPDRIPLLRPSACQCTPNDYDVNQKFKMADNCYNFNDKTSYSNVKSFITDDELITEKYYNNDLFNQVEIIDNYETQANFVRDLFESENNSQSVELNANKYDENINYDNYEGIAHNVNGIDCKCDLELTFKDDIDIDSDVDAGCQKEVKCGCRVSDRKCEVGCGCACDVCYSDCWPKDWIKIDYPEARVISINYTSDPYLWRPLWVKECKRLRLHERADQMTRQLLEMGVGQKPVIWVGHSKGGLFIKQIYCEAYEAYQKLRKKYSSEHKEINDVVQFNNNNFDYINNSKVQNNNNCVSLNNKDSFYSFLKANNFSNVNCENGGSMTDYVNSLEERNVSMDSGLSSNNEEDQLIWRQAQLWANSAGFMFYSVPHRGSPLAGIKTPITARSIELLEISKDCSLVLSLQDRWLQATATSRPRVRSLVETCRTLMSVLWLRIVSVPSADAGIGALYGVALDHREICKPSSRECLLYKELMALMRAALNECKCDN